MGISHYLAMTAEEMAAASFCPDSIAFMACHFSPYGTGITGCPEALPPNSMLILNDRIPFRGHDEAFIADQLGQLAEMLQCTRLLLDFQRPDTPLSLGQTLVQTLSLPVCMPSAYAEGIACPVFLPPVPPDQSLETYLQPWIGREIWLETTPESHLLTLDSQGCRRTQAPPVQEQDLLLSDSCLHCHYRTTIFTDKAEFLLQRTAEDMVQLLLNGDSLGIACTVALYQQVKKLPVK